MESIEGHRCKSLDWVTVAHQFRGTQKALSPVLATKIVILSRKLIPGPNSEGSPAYRTVQGERPTPSCLGLHNGLPVSAFISKGLVIVNDNYGIAKEMIMNPQTSGDRSAFCLGAWYTE